MGGAIERSVLEEEVFARLPREAAELVAQLLLEAGDEASKALSRRLSDRLGFSLSAAPPGAGVFGGLPFFPVEERKRKPPNLAACRPLDPDEIGDWFREGGRLSDLPGFERRPEQEALAKAVADAFSGGRHLAAEAGTGIGKTMAYLVPAALWSLRCDVPVVVSTNTKNLQEQIFRKDLPAIAARLRAPMRFALVKGRSNYLCLSRLERLADRRDAELSQGELPALAQAVVWAFLTPDGDLAAFDPPVPPDAPPGPRLAERLASNADDCRGRKCPHYRRCFLQRARALSLAADVVVTNHAVFFSEPPDRPLALPRAAQVVFDEAHNLEDAATAHFSREFTPRDVRDLARRLHRKGRGGRGRGAGAAATGALPDLERALLAPAADGAPPELRTALFGGVADARGALEAATLSAQRYFLALGALPPPGENALRLVPAVLAGRAWAETVPLLQRLQDDLFRLSEALGGLARGLVPPPGAGETLPFAVPEAAPAPDAPDAPRAPRSLREIDQRDLGDRGAKKEAAPLSDLGVPAELAQRVETAAAGAKGLLETLDFLASAQDREWTFWISAQRAPAAGTRRRGPGPGPAAVGSLHAAPVEVAPFLASSVFGKLDSAVLCSATLTVGGKPDFLAGRLGLDRVDPDRLSTLFLGSPFDYARQCLAAVASFLPAQPAGPAGETSDGPFAQAFARLVEGLSRAARGRTLVLFTSYRAMETCARLAGPGLEGAGLRLLVQGDGASRETLARRFREQAKPTVLFGTDSFWEGVDVMGEALSCLVIAKLPFDAVGDPVVAARCERVRENGGEAFHDYSLPAAVIKFRQGFGRLIRHKSDRGCVVVADTRIATKNYGGAFRKSLPAELRAFPDEASLLAAVADFLAAPGAGGAGRAGDCPAPALLV